MALVKGVGLLCRVHDRDCGRRVLAFVGAVPQLLWLALHRLHQAEHLANLLRLFDEFF